MSKLQNQVILITGCSSGIGRALTNVLAEQGHRVVATARKPESITDLAGEHVTTMALDVTDPASIERAVGAVVEREGRIDILINNAGFGLIGPVAEVALSDLRLQLETNVIGPVALIQAIVPWMAKQGGGRIVNVGSVSGITATPFSGAYCASKAALHLLSDALRMELKPFNIDVLQLQPGGVRSKFGDTASTRLDRYHDPDSLYRPIVEGIEQRAGMSQGSPTTTEDYAADVAGVLTRKRIPAVYRSGHGSTLMPLLRYTLPSGLRDRVMMRKFELNKLGKG